MTVKSSLLFVFVLAFTSCAAIKNFIPEPAPVVEPQKECVEKKSDRGRYVGCEAHCYTEAKGHEHVLLQARQLAEEVCVRNDILECVMRAVYENDRFYSLDKASFKKEPQPDQL